VNSLPKTVTRQRRGCDLNPGLTVPESSTLTTWLGTTLAKSSSSSSSYRVAGEGSHIVAPPCPRSTIRISLNLLILKVTNFNKFLKMPTEFYFEIEYFNYD